MNVRGRTSKEAGKIKKRELIRFDPRSLITGIIKLMVMRWRGRMERTWGRGKCV
jgi:hypothetical protein